MLRGLRFAVLAVTSIFRLNCITYARVIKVLASDASIQFSGGWKPPSHFNWDPELDTLGVGGPNSTVCAIGDVSRYTRLDGESFTFQFHGLSAQLVFSSRNDHAAFDVQYDGADTPPGDTFSEVVHCGVAWGSPRGVLENHTLTCTSRQTTSGRDFLELLSILYDDGKSEEETATVTESSSLTTSAKLRGNSASSTGGTTITGDPAPSSNSPATAESQSSSSQSASLGTAGIVGIAVGTTIAMCIFAVLLLAWWRVRCNRERGFAVHPVPNSAEIYVAVDHDHGGDIQPWAYPGPQVITSNTGLDAAPPTYDNSSLSYLNRVEQKFALLKRG